MISRSLALFLAFSGALLSIAAAQSADGYTEQQLGGVALVKPQSWSSANDTTVVEFKAYTDRTVRGTPGAGYYIFKSPAGNDRQISASKVAELFIYPSAAVLSRIANDTDKQNLEKLIGQMKKLIATYPATASYINPKIKQVEGELAQYASGKVKYDGEWMERTAHQREKADQIIALIKADISRTKVASDYDMQSDPRYQALLTMKDASVGPLVEELVAFYDKKDRADQRTKLLAELNSKDTTFSEAQTSVMALKSLKPEEDPNAESFLKSWDASADAYEKITRSLKNATVEFEKLFSGGELLTEFPVLPEALAKELPGLSKSITDYQATKYPPQLELPPDLSSSIKDFAKSYPSLQKQLADHKLFEAKDTLDSLVDPASHIGAKTRAAFIKTQKYLVAQISQFTKLRDEAKLLEGTSKPQEALAKYESAYSIVADDAVAQQIELLKKTSP
jgi:hypothetical protein